MLTINTNAQAFVRFIGGTYVSAYQMAYDAGHGTFDKVIHEAKPDNEFDWRTACDYGFMALLYDELVEVSERRRINRNEKGLFADACASLVDRQLDQFLHSVGTAAHPIADYPKYLASTVQGEFEGHGLLPRMIAQMLTRERNDLFTSEEYTSQDNLFTTVAHPMHTFVKWLDQLEHDKVVDPIGYKQKYQMKRRIVALHRVGLAMLPAATWHNSIAA